MQSSKHSFWSKSDLCCLSAGHKQEVLGEKMRKKAKTEKPQICYSSTEWKERLTGKTRLGPVAGNQLQVILQGVLMLEWNWMVCSSLCHVALSLSSAPWQITWPLTQIPQGVGPADSHIKWLWSPHLELSKKTYQKHCTMFERVSSFAKPKTDLLRTPRDSPQTYH